MATTKNYPDTSDNSSAKSARGEIVLKPTDQWGTPRWLYRLLNNEFPFDCDVCASAENYKHERYIDEERNALSYLTAWGAYNFCNPPYSNILPWYKRAILERDEMGCDTTFVTKLDFSTRHGKLASEEMDEIRIIEHRIKYEGAPTGANFPSAVMVCRPRLYTRKTGARILYVDYRDAITEAA